MAPASKKPCVYGDAGCTLKTPHHALITIRAETEAHMRTRPFKLLHNPMTEENRQCKQDREEANEQRPSRGGKSPGKKKPPKTSQSGGTAKAKRPPRRTYLRETAKAKEPLPRSCQRGTTKDKELPRRHQERPATAQRGNAPSYQHGTAPNTRRQHQGENPR